MSGSVHISTFYPLPSTLFPPKTTLQTFLSPHSSLLTPLSSLLFNNNYNFSLTSIPTWSGVPRWAKERRTPSTLLFTKNVL